MINYKEFFTTENKTGRKNCPKFLKKHYPEIYDMVLNFNNTPELLNITFKQKIWHFINNITEIPTCLNCDNNVKFGKSLNSGYRLSCSPKCSANTERRKELTKITCNLKYGTDHYGKTIESKEKYKATCIKKYGVDNVSKVKEIREKVEQTTLKNHGNKSYLGTQKLRDEFKEYCMKTYGVDHNSKSPEVREKFKKTLLERYGSEKLMLVPEFIEKQKETLLKNHGVTNPMFSKELKEKCFNNLRESFFKKFLNRFDINKIDNITGYTGDNLHVVCKNGCHNYTISRELFILRTKKDRPTCTECNPFYKQGSFAESNLASFISSFEIPIILKNRKILDGKELDIYIPSYNLAIEFDGLYWHSNALIEDDLHLFKTNKCKENGIDLIHVFEDEWESKQDIVKSNIKNILNLNIDTIQSTDCTILEVDLSTTKEFLNKNHIEGYTDYDFSYGLFFQDQLVSIICLKKINEGYEIVRDCDLLNIDVVDGFNTLLNHFIDSHKPNKIIVYADRRWYFGGKYEKSNFILSKTIKPKYRYVVNNKRKTIAEYKELNLEEKHFKIYDCGYFEYELMIS